VTTVSYEMLGDNKQGASPKLQVLTYTVIEDSPHKWRNERKPSDNAMECARGMRPLGDLMRSGD
jgi:hypothetical protein